MKLISFLYLSYFSVLSKRLLRRYCSLMQIYLFFATMQNERNENQDETMSFFSIGTFFKLFKTKQASIIKTTSITHEEKRASNIKKTSKQR